MDELGLKWNEDGQAWKISIEVSDLPKLRKSTETENFLLASTFLSIS